MAGASEYAWYPGHNIALGTLTAITSITQYKHGGVGVDPVSDPVNLYPVRTRLESGRERMDGRVDHVWRWPVALKIDAVDYLIDTFFGTPTGFDALVTINTRLHDRASWVRYNAYIAYPVPGQDYQLDRGYVFDFVVRFSTLTAAS